ncbi:hypothetical protein ACQ4PT_056210 [Festuca glaucescens]
MAACAAGGTNAGAAAGAAGAGSPCGACKFLRRRCVQECVFAPYFSTDQGAARFAAIHKVAILQAQLMQAKAQLACGVQSTTSPMSHHQQWPDSSSIAAMLRQQDANSGGFGGGGALLPELMGGDVSMSMMQQHCGKVDGGAGELQYLAQAMMQSSNYSQ